MALYVNGDAFVEAYGRLKARGLVFNNPRFPQFSYATLALALHHNEFRVRDLVDDAGAVVYELEHEIRSLLHPGFAATRLADGGDL